jgi:hypothetical protein
MAPTPHAYLRRLKVNSFEQVATLDATVSALPGLWLLFSHSSHEMTAFAAVGRLIMLCR